eukprot:GEMP01023036.1.p1 GENE.GEMP01023036.1~~GEMP01023036.1.p1  ORF type:complete len:349 (+),score=75.32 GEMP01023036.1:184-1230(+)
MYSFYADTYLKKNKPMDCPEPEWARGIPKRPRPAPKKCPKAGNLRRVQKRPLSGSVQYPEQEMSKRLRPVEDIVLECSLKADQLGKIRKQTVKAAQKIESAYLDRRPPQKLRDDAKAQETCPAIIEIMEDCDNEGEGLLQHVSIAANADSSPDATESGILPGSSLDEADSSPVVEETSHDVHEEGSYLDDEANVREMAKKALKKTTGKWGEQLEVAAYEAASAACADLKDYRKLVRLITTNLRRPQSQHVVDRLDSGALTCSEVMAFTPDDYQPNKRKQEVQREESPFFLANSYLTCECGSKDVKYMNVSSARDGYCKAETWGRKDDAGPSARAQCLTCLLEWNFEPQ